MLIGPLSAQNVRDLGGVTIHRRKIAVLKLAVDLHCRVGAQDLQTSCFSDFGYLERLGCALGEMKPHIWEDFVGDVIRRITNHDPPRATRTSISYSFPDDVVLYKQLLETELGQAIRNMMSKYFFHGARNLFYWLRVELETK